MGKPSRGWGGKTFALYKAENSFPGKQRHVTMSHLMESERAGPAEWNFFLRFYSIAVVFHLVFLRLTVLPGWDLMVALFFSLV